MKTAMKALAIILACIMAFSSVSLAVDSQPTNKDELTTDTVEKTTKEVENETTTSPADKTTTAENENSAPTEDETTTTLPQETTREDIKLPEAPMTVNCEAIDGECIAYWDAVPMVDGYDVFIKVDGKWVYNTSSNVHYTTATLKGLLCTKKYEIGVRSFKIVNEEKYYSENITTCVGGPGNTFPYISFQASVYLGGFNIKWNTLDCVSGYLVYIRQNNKWVKIATISDSAIGEYNYKCKDIKNNTNYKFAIKAFVKGDNGTKYGDIYTYTLNSGNVGKPELSKGGETATSVTLKWNKVKGAKGYKVYKYDTKGKKYVAVKTTSALQYEAKGIEDGKKYSFKVRAYYKADGETKWGAYSDVLTISEIGKTKLSKSKVTATSVTLKWSKVESAKGYKVYKYDSSKKKYIAVATTSKLSYTVTQLNPSTTYSFKVRAYYKTGDKTKLCTFSNKISTATSSKTVKAKYISKYKKYFTDGTWSVKLGTMYDEVGNQFYLTIAVKGNNIYAEYDYKDSRLTDFKYLIQLDKERVYLIDDDIKTYYALPKDVAYYVELSMLGIVSVVDMSNAKGVTAKTTQYSGKPAIVETYSDKAWGITKSYTFYNDVIKKLKVSYSDGTNETYSILKIVDTPSASLFKLPSGYKKAKYTF